MTPLRLGLGALVLLLGASVPYKDQSFCNLVPSPFRRLRPYRCFSVFYNAKLHSSLVKVTTLPAVLPFLELKIYGASLMQPLMPAQPPLLFLAELCSIFLVLPVVAMSPRPSFLTSLTPA